VAFSRENFTFYLVVSAAVTINNTVFYNVVNIFEVYKQHDASVFMAECYENVIVERNCTHTLKMEATRPSETFVNLYQNTQRSIPFFKELQR
jgi:hypothetical protein